MATEHTFQVDGFGGTETRRITPLQAIRLQCRECYGFDPAWREDVKECLSTLCPLYPFRLGRDPGRAPKSEKHIQAARRNITKSRSHRG